MKFKEIFEKKSVHIISLALVAVLLYSISWNYEMYQCLDDGPYVLNNKYLAFKLENIIRWLTQPCIGLFVPVTMFSFMFDYSIWEVEPMGYHLQNTFWFIITIIAVYGCFVKMKIKPWYAFVLLLIYTVHPQRVESVVWITERKDVLSGAFFFLALYSYLHKLDKDKFNYQTFILYVIALFAKPMAVTLPVVLAMIDFSRNRRFSPAYYIKKFWPYALVIVVYFIIISNLRRDFIRPPVDAGRMVSVNMFNIYWYMKSSIIPNFHNMSVLYPKIIFNRQAIIRMLLFYILATAISIIALLKVKKAALLYSVLPVVICYIAVLSPVLGSFRFSSSDYTDRYNYIPFVFILFSAGCIIPFAISKRTRNLIALCTILYIIFLTYSTISYIPYWKNSFSVYAKSCEHQPANPWSVLTLGLLKAKSGDYQEASVLSERLRHEYLNEDLKMPGPVHAGQLYIKAIVLYETGEKLRAFKILSYMCKDNFLRNFVCKRWSDGEAFYSMLANCYLVKRMVKNAVLCFKEIIKLDYVSNQNILFYKGMIAFFENRKQEAAGYLEKAHELAPDDENISHNLKMMKESLKEQKPAVKK